MTLSLSARFRVCFFEVFLLCHLATQRHQSPLPFEYHHNAIRRARMVYPPRNLIRKDAHTTLSRTISPPSRTTTQSNPSLPTPKNNIHRPVPSETARYLRQGHPLLWRGREHR
ncbi:hypothetical protein ARMGADRAFT_105024 [Armillaria gallica]|uniref:Secreted protein n=1 Tax=Armillaria gallica TaxID=47427 RepID=A0A2H3CCZ1_ARMGA|nr:hypothetical protein ARMGADRAFT_105024 [Armillaria gallica]